MTNRQKLRSLSKKLKWDLKYRTQEGMGGFSAVAVLTVNGECIESIPYKDSDLNAAKEMTATKLIEIVRDRDLVRDSLKRHVERFATDYAGAFDSTWKKMGWPRPEIKVEPSNGKHPFKGAGLFKTKEWTIQAAAVGDTEDQVRNKICHGLLIKLGLLK